MRLRDDVEVAVRADETVFTDRSTGLCITVGQRISLDTERSGPSSDSSQSDVWRVLRSYGLVDEGLSRSEVLARQRPHRQRALEHQCLDRLNQLLVRVTADVPYYRDRASAYAAPLADLSDIARLPMLDKADLRSELTRGLVADNVAVGDRLRDGTIVLTSTSGSTEERLQVFSDVSLPALPELFYEIWNLTPLAHTPRTAVLTSPACMGAACNRGAAPYQQRLRNDYTLYLQSVDDLFSISPDRIASIAAELVEFRPDFLFANPVYLHWFARRCREEQLELPPIALIISSYQYLSRAQRCALERYFSAPVVNHYDATELGGCRAGIECHQGRLHVRCDHSLLEIVDAHGRRSGSDIGAIAITTLAADVAPLIRYRPGDLGRWTDEDCTCVIADWPCFELHGRARDVIRVDDGTTDGTAVRQITTRQFDDVVADTPGLEFYQCSQTGPAEVELAVIPSLGASLDVQDLRERVEGLGFSTVRVQVRRRLEPQPSGKFRLIRSRVDQPLGFL